MKKLLEETAATIREHYRNAADPLSEQFAFARRETEGEIQGPPLVFVLGNHSSGKSTFINHLLGDDVQKTGLAPTDDGFTVIRHGANEEVRDGTAVVGNPDLPFEGLRQFGNDLVTHLKLKLRPNELLEHVSIVDSPGMIDDVEAGKGRGFDFANVVRWFAERADVVLVFFDPDKPGTTGETLHVFNHALQGIDHKLLIVMNKTDQFRSLHDFARAYGALCWNLGKVIPRKDLPMIYNTFVPVAGAPDPVLPVEDFQAAREELIAEVRRAPNRRVDNMLTQLEQFTSRLRLHCRVVDEAARDVRRFRGKAWFVLVILVLSAIAGGTISLGVESSIWLTIGLYAGAGLIGYAGYFVIRFLTKREERHAIDGIGSIFERLYGRELLIRDRSDDLKALWRSVVPRTKETIEKLGLLSFKKLRNSDIKKIDQLLDSELPKLRSKVHAEFEKTQEKVEA